MHLSLLHWIFFVSIRSVESTPSVCSLPGRPGRWVSGFSFEDGQTHKGRHAPEHRVFRRFWKTTNYDKSPLPSYYLSLGILAFLLTTVTSLLKTGKGGLKNAVLNSQLPDGEIGRGKPTLEKSHNINSRCFSRKRCFWHGLAILM